MIKYEIGFLRNVNINRNILVHLWIQMDSLSIAMLIVQLWIQMTPNFILLKNSMIMDSSGPFHIMVL